MKRMRTSQKIRGRRRRRMNPYIRTILSAATLTLIALYGWSVQPSFLTWSALGAMASLYLVMIWARQDQWTHARFAAIACLVIALTLVAFLSEGGDADASLLLVPLIALLAKEQEDYRRLAMGLAAVTLTMMAALTRLAPFLLAAALTLYFGIRAINIYKGA